MAFAGKLYVTGRHACFHAPAEKVAFALAHDDLRSVAKLPPAPGAKAGAQPLSADLPRPYLRAVAKLPPAPGAKAGAWPSVPCCASDRPA